MISSVGHLCREEQFWNQRKYSSAEMVRFARLFMFVCIVRNSVETGLVGFILSPPEYDSMRYHSILPDLPSHAKMKSHLINVVRPR